MILAGAIGIAAGPASAASTSLHKGQFTVEVTPSSITGPGACPSVGDNGVIFTGTMKGYFGKGPVEVDVYETLTPLNGPSCISKALSICTPDNILALVADVTVCSPAKDSQPDDILGGWEIAAPTPSITDAWGSLTGTDTNPGASDEALKLNLKAIVQDAQ